jgi:hypothetical protein
MKMMIVALALFPSRRSTRCAAFAGPSEQAPRIIAAQLRRQGVACTTGRGDVLDSENSTPNETVWILGREEASYRVTLIPHCAREACGRQAP